MPDPTDAGHSGCELSIVLPCLNEAATVAVCVTKAVRFLAEQGIRGEVIVADNGSTDGSRELAQGAGARVVPVSGRGYGSALQGGIRSARGRFVIMGDADDSYDFSALLPFIERLRGGAELVQGCRLPAGGGRVADGAMPFLHRWLGNPLFTLLARRMFGAPVHDIYCGLRGFTRELYDRMEMRCPGMEFATEMIIKASRAGVRIAEVPITLHPDGRQGQAPHLKTWRDGWRTLRFFLICSPRWLFFYPGLLLLLLGVGGYAVALPGLTILGATFDAHTLLFASLALLLGFQAVLFAGVAWNVAAAEGLAERTESWVRLLGAIHLERGLAFGVVLLGLGLALLAAAIGQWYAVDFGRLDYAHTMRWVIPGVTLTALGFQTVLASFLVAVLGWNRRPGPDAYE